MSENLKSPYMNHVRELRTRVYMGFYQNTGEDIGEAHINREGWSWNENNEVVAPNSDLFNNKAKQILTYGLNSFKYGTLDSKSQIDGVVRIAGQSPDCITGLWSDVLSDASTGAFSGKKPTFTILYNQERLLSELNVIGNRSWEQFPVEYDLIVYMPQQIATMRLPLTRMVANVSETLTVMGVVENNYVKFHVNGATAIDQTIVFTDEAGSPLSLATEKISLIIYRWSEPGAVAKIMFFSRDRSLSYTSKDVKNITVYEEKTASMDELTFGVSSNSCNVEVSNASGIFDNNPDFLRRGKLLIPSVGIAGQKGYQRLGKFYTETWERSSDSKFITCKGYDILYGLQSIMISIPYEGNLVDGFKPPAFANVFEAFTKVFDTINEEKHRNEIYGADVEYVIDKSLKFIPFSNALFEEKSAWDILQELCNYSLSHVYTDREGIVHVKNDMNNVSAPLKENVYIDPSNSFSYSLPVQSRTIVNKITVPYKYISEGNEADNTITIDKEKVITQDDAMTFSVDLKNYYPNGVRFELYKNNSENIPLLINDQIKSINVFYNKIYIKTYIINQFDSLKIIVKSFDSSVIQLKQTEYLFQANDGMASIKKNGICQLDFPSTSFADITAAKRIAENIINKYNNGVEYVEAKWTGSPDLAISDIIQCSCLQDKEKNSYESYSNEFTIDGAMRVMSKLRKVQQL